ncbi:hypothetical protein PsorP6_014929 [Peronosclerospora sorghi]|uniref:Uncharacterized protein n=1 Tax=Peronosclerospora sorghi TaxID=230839 RepID=A0ACC0VW65_9STRA|nr:hypothetical protein PsorP6_014929 [Peronosclerospora sorghi]
MNEEMLGKDWTPSSAHVLEQRMFPSTSDVAEVRTSVKPRSESASNAWDNVLGTFPGVARDPGGRHGSHVHGPPRENPSPYHYSQCVFSS